MLYILIPVILVGVLVWAIWDKGYSNTAENEWYEIEHRKHLK